MPSYDTRRSPDYSPYVVHFTKDKPILRRDLIREGDPLYEFRTSSAQDRLKNILTTKAVESSPMPFLPNSPRAVCFTECTWDSLVQLAEGYSSYALVFPKRLVFERGGGPALYVRGDQLTEIASAKTVPPVLEPFIAPFDPDGVIKSGVKIDYIHEREWRLPSRLTFEYADVANVIVPSLQDVDPIVRHFGSSSLPDLKFIPMSVYEQIRKAWGGT